MPNIQVIAFDLDDTLVDTSGVLIPQALQNIYSALKKHGWKKSYEEFNQQRLSLTHDFSHKKIFSDMVKELNLPAQENETLTKECVDYFYEPNVPNPLPLMPGALQTLNYLKNKYSLYLVSSGSLQGQKKKIAACGIEAFFKAVFIVPTQDHVDKKMAFQTILQQEGISASRLLSIGNRLSNEIRFAKELGAMTCYLQYGEHAHEKSQGPLEHPDFTIHALQDFVSTCQL